MRENEAEHGQLEAFKMRLRQVLDRSRVKDAENVKSLDTVTSDFMVLYEQFESLLNKIVQTNEKDAVVAMMAEVKQLSDKANQKLAELRMSPDGKADKVREDMDNNLSSLYSFIKNKISVIRMSIELLDSGTDTIDTAKADVQQTIDELK